MKSKRQEKILELIHDHSVQTQEQLRAAGRGAIRLRLPARFCARATAAPSSATAR